MGVGDILKNALSSSPSLGPLNALRAIDALADKDGPTRSTVRDIQNALDKHVGPYRHDPSREGSGLDLRNVPGSGFYTGPSPNLQPVMNPAEESARTGKSLRGGIYSEPNRTGGPNPAEQSARFGTSLGRSQPPGSSGSSGPSIESLYEQLANSQRGGAQGRYDELSSFLSTEGARRNAQIDSDETSLLKQLQDSESKRLVGEDFYRDRRAGEYADLENKLSIYGSAGSQRLSDLGIDPQLYTAAVGQQMGTLLGAQMQSGNDLMNRMSQLGAERASMVLGRASAGMSKERRALDAAVASMMFQGSQTLSYELQDINEALMERRIDAATAQRAIDQKTKEAAQKAQAANDLYLALNPEGDPNTGANLASLGVFDDYFKEKIKPEETPELTQIITQDFIDAYGLPQNILGAELSINEILKFADLAKTAAQISDMNIGS